jgi:hypothetical protein
LSAVFILRSSAAASSNNRSHSHFFGMWKPPSIYCSVMLIADSINEVERRCRDTGASAQ